jgi:hypothetical protein
MTSSPNCPVPPTFHPGVGGRRDLVTDVLWNGVAGGVVAWVLVGVCRNVVTRQDAHPVTGWGSGLLLLLGVAIVVGALVKALRGFTRALRAPRRLAGVAGVPATICPSLRGTRWWVAARLTPSTEPDVFLQSDRFPPPGTAGTLYQRGRTAAFVTDTGTFWAV